MSSLPVSFLWHSDFFPSLVGPKSERPGRGSSEKMLNRTHGICYSSHSPWCWLRCRGEKPWGLTTSKTSHQGWPPITGCTWRKREIVKINSADRRTGSTEESSDSAWYEALLWWCVVIIHLHESIFASNRGIQQGRGYVWSIFLPSTWHQSVFLVNI